MALHESTGSRNKSLDTGSVKSVYNLGFINVYAGTVPADADASIGSATLLYVLSNNSTGTGLTMGTAASGVLPKNSGEVWSGVAVAGGTASFYRHVAVGDTGASSTTEARFQGAIATAGSEMNLTTATITNGATQTLNAYSIAQPTL